MSKKLFRCRVHVCACVDHLLTLSNTFAHTNSVFVLFEIFQSPCRVRAVFHRVCVCVPIFQIVCAYVPVFQRVCAYVPALAIDLGHLWMLRLPSCLC